MGGYDPRQMELLVCGGGGVGFVKRQHKTVWETISLGGGLVAADVRQL